MNNIMQSNAIRGEYLNTCRDKTIREIHDDMVTIFGPGATDAFITKDGQPYFTRDGKEVAASMKFDNPVGMYILKILFQAIADQAKAVGDGTTTLSVLYTNLMLTCAKHFDSHERVDAKLWRHLMGLIVERLKTKAVPMTDEDFRHMLLTCTQDKELAEKIYTNLKDAIMGGAYITVSKSNFEEDFTMTVHDSPVIKATLQYSVGPFHSTEKRCIVFHCDGNLDISHQEVILDMMSRVPTYGEEDNAIPRPITIIILCNGVTQATREMTKKLNQTLDSLCKTNPDILQQYNNVAIMTMSDYRSYSAEQREDVSTIITDEVGMGGLVNDLTFESYLYQAFGNPEVDIPELKLFDADISIITKLREMMAQPPYPVTYDRLHGLRLEKPLGPVSQARYDELRAQLEKEKSEVVKNGLMRRLKTMYGRFIDIEVGSTLIKDSQMKYELIVDAVVSASEAIEKGVLRANSLLMLYNVIVEMRSNLDSIDWACPCKEQSYLIMLQDTLRTTIGDLVRNCWEDFNEQNIDTWVGDGDLPKFNLTRACFKDVLPRLPGKEEPRPEPEKPDWCEYDDSWVIAADVFPSRENSLNEDISIVEPVSVICRMLENSTVAIDLINAKTIHVDKYMDNYI